MSRRVIRPVALENEIIRDIQHHYDSNEGILLNGWSQFNANEEIPLKMKIGSILFSTDTNSNDENRSLLSHYFSIFSFEQREQIRNVFERVRQKVPAPEEIHFGCTRLTLFEGNEMQEVFIFRCIQPSTEKIFFIEPNGRTYETWNDFLTSNRIANGCEYFAPSDGVYSITGQICKFKRERISNIKPAVFVAGLAIILANILSEVPVTILRMAANTYGMYKCVSNMIDKRKHLEPITLSEYLVFTSTYSTLLCSALVYYVKDIFEFNVFGVYWGEIALTFFVLGVLCLNVYIFFKNVDDSWSNITDVRISDLFSLLLQAILLYEQIQNTREIIKLLSKRSYNPFIRSKTRSQVQNSKTGAQNLNSAKSASSRKAKMDNIMPQRVERAENTKVEEDDGFQKYLYDSIDPIVERMKRRFGYKTKKKGFFSNFMDGLFSFAGLYLGGWFPSLFGWMRDLFN